MRALSIRQPFAELILRGIKTVELRSISTTIIGERFYIYASLRQAQDWRKGKVWSRDLSTLRAPLPPWMIELAEQVKLIEPDFDKLSRAIALLPTGVIVGSAVIEKVEEYARSTSSGHATYAWYLTDVQRAKRFRKPKKHPQPVWFRPFD